jgi:hypothetical protein
MGYRHVTVLMDMLDEGAKNVPQDIQEILYNLEIIANKVNKLKTKIIIKSMYICSIHTL